MNKQAGGAGALSGFGIWMAAIVLAWLLARSCLCLESGAPNGPATFSVCAEP